MKCFGTLVLFGLIGLCSLVMTLAPLFIAQPLRAQELDLDTPAWIAASHVKGYYESEIDILNICQEIDGKNVAAYKDAIAGLATIANPALNQVEKVMRGEGQRAGKSADWLAEANQEIDHLASLTAEEERKHPEKLLSDCRAVPEQVKAHAGFFVPLRDQFPKQMHIVEQWR